MLLPARIESSRRRTTPAILVAHADQSGSRFHLAALVGVGLQRAPRPIAPTRRWSAIEARRLRAALVDRAILAANLDGVAWRADAAGDARADRRHVDGGRRGEVEQFGQEQASAVLVPPFQLRALRAALRR